MKKEKEEKKYTDFANVEDQRKLLATEEFPEGSFGTPRNSDTPVENKETPWEEGQQFTSGFTYENRTLHQGLPRQFPGAHPPHDNPDDDKEPPYEDYNA
ncbi:hypothetical protein JOD43_000583 [Pullulanibacillus pueri]|uniref:Cytosolic protein n=1 Tax=Pullulanibacillus pueri TaxID=1437324 RepID=A0A8J2ZS28_9BACL|nr:hypothetical protein [Pullulanibacillus pueri]GGH75153.1 hypothetical protein GCM10007096_04080 [Pullulanibacillus pueri]